MRSPKRDHLLAWRRLLQEKRAENQKLSADLAIAKQQIALEANATADLNAQLAEARKAHFSNRALKVKEEIRALPVAEKFRLVADFIDAGPMHVSRELTVSLSRLAVAELEKQP